MYKITMQRYSGKHEAWTVMDQDEIYGRAVRYLEAYRASLPNRKFRLEKHTMEVIDV